MLGIVFLLLQLRGHYHRLYGLLCLIWEQKTPYLQIVANCRNVLVLFKKSKFVYSYKLRKVGDYGPTICESNCCFKRDI